ncbi:unnamed protein product [Microthlaspi erraticum]|uniref:Uncharacterized protein n=1 Tax=Microthlaspi erraticum TaxID=1685480 RepID=A0A6D2IRT3_9BRAS|nr:unnamed protein product [Microthlaspi erraticum]
MANNVIKTSRVGPATSLVDPLILPLTFFDLVWLPDKPTNRVIFYKLTESSSDSFYSVILPKLEQSLSLVLTHFLPLSGHVKWDPQDPKPYIAVFPQDSVSLTVAEITDADFSRVSGKGLRHQTELHPLVSELPVSSSDSASAFTLQITLFPKQGFCIGLTINHLVMDGKTVVKFLKSWAHICKYGTTPQDLDLPMLLDRKVINILPELESDFFKRTPYLSGNARGDDGDTVPFTFVADFRDRLDPPVPVNYFGNCVYLSASLETKPRRFWRRWICKCCQDSKRFGEGLIHEELSQYGSCTRKE